MKMMYSSLVIVAIVLSMAIAIPSDLTQTADAVKAKGVKNNQYGAETKTKVCGDRLCTPSDFTKHGERKDIIPTGESTISSQIIMSKMQRLMDLHRSQLLTALESMDDSEKSHLMKMMDKMYEKMKSMDFRDHMKKMSKMMGDGHGMKYGHDKSDCSCGDGESKCSCGDGESKCSCGDGESMACEVDEKCNCGEDGVCNCGEGCTCASCH